MTSGLKVISKWYNKVGLVYEAKISKFLAKCRYKNVYKVLCGLVFVCVYVLLYVSVYREYSVSVF